MLIGGGGRLGQECAHSALLNHPLGFIGRGKILSQALWPGMEARFRGSDGQLAAPSKQTIDAVGTYRSRDGLIRRAIANRLRFGRDGGLIEGGRANISLQNTAYNVTWDQFNGMVVTANDAVSPDGTLSADKIADTSGSLLSIIRKAWPLTLSGDKVVMSVYVLKESPAAPFPNMQFNLTGGTQVLSAGRINTDTGATFTSGADSTASERLGAYWRWWVVDTDNDSGNDTARQAFNPAIASTIDGASDNSLTGDITVWGSQVELGAFPSSLIFVTTVAVTRVADALEYA